jgi:hypothetical protein
MRTITEYNKQGIKFLQDHKVGMGAVAREKYNTHKGLSFYKIVMLLGQTKKKKQ